MGRRRFNAKAPPRERPNHRERSSLLSVQNHNCRHAIQTALRCYSAEWHDGPDYRRTAILNLHHSLLPPQYVRREWFYNIAARCGAYRSYTQVDLAKVTRIVFVCKGNICRSPFAAAVAKSIGAPAASFGLAARQGLTADPVALRVAEKFGVSLSAHRTQSIVDAVFTGHDLIAVMEPGQNKALRAFLGCEISRRTILGLWCAPPSPYLFDPYGMSENDFDRCFSLIHEATVRLVTACQAIRR